MVNRSVGETLNADVFLLAVYLVGRHAAGRQMARLDERRWRPAFGSSDGSGA
jgi:hypothetical protein